MIESNLIVKCCKTCKETKPSKDFISDRLSCRKCVTKINLQRLNASPEKLKQFKEKQKSWESRNHDYRKKYDLNWRKNNNERLLLYHAKCRAKKYNVKFNLNLDDIVIPLVCPVLGIELKHNVGKGNVSSDNSPSIDRIIPNLGYVKENIRIISCRANTIKNSGTVEEHEKIIKYMKENT